LTEPSIGAKYVGRTVSMSAASACEPPPSISGIVPATNHACAAPAAGTRGRGQRIAPLPRPRHGGIGRMGPGSPLAGEAPDALLRRLGPAPVEADGLNLADALAAIYAHLAEAAERRALSG